MNQPGDLDTPEMREILAKIPPPQYPTTSKTTSELCNPETVLNLGRIAEAAMKVSLFVRYHKYPKEGSPDFYALLQLLDAQDVACRRLSVPLEWIGIKP